MFDALISALKHSAPSCTASSLLALPFEPSYQQFPFDKAILLNTHNLIFHPLPQPQQPHHVPFSTTTTVCFNVMPRSKRHLQENEFIWWAVNNSSLAVPKHLQSLLHPLPTVPDAAAFALAVPSKLAAFLQQVSLPDMRIAIVDMLADAYRSETPDCMLDLRNKLEPTVWHDITAALNGQLATTRRSETACVLLDFVMESCRPDDGWTIQVTTALSGPPALPFLGGVVLQSMHQDWMLYLKYIRNSRHAWNTMQKLTRQGRQAQVWERVRAITFCANRQHSYVSMLPTQIVESVLIPWLLFTEASGGRRGTIESLTTPEYQTLVQ